MASSTSLTSLSSITVTVSHAIAYITRPLVAFMPSSTVTKLQLALEANLTAHYALSWVPSEPSRGSGRRCIAFSPTSLPPRPIYASCKAAKVQWSEWMTALGNVEFDLFVDPGLVSVRFVQQSATSKLITVWSEEGAEEIQSQSLGTRAIDSPTQRRVPSLTRPKAGPAIPTLAQQLMIEDEEDEEELFAALADELREPTWTTPVLNQFPPTIPQKAKHSASSASHHSRSSSLSSDTCSWLSFDSNDSDTSSATTISSAGTEASTLSRRERTRQARVFIDASKKEVTNYDGGKTTVLTGGVMLGARSVSAKPATSTLTKPMNIAASSRNWRSTRA